MKFGKYNLCETVSQYELISINYQPKIMNIISKISIQILFLIFFQFNSSNAQNCLPGSTTFDEQSDIDNFSTNFLGCTNIEGDLLIQPSLDND